jgi:hypothetical protein
MAQFFKYKLYYLNSCTTSHHHMHTNIYIYTLVRKLDLYLTKRIARGWEVSKVFQASYMTGTSSWPLWHIHVWDNGIYIETTIPGDPGGKITRSNRLKPWAVASTSGAYQPSYGSVPTWWALKRKMQCHSLFVLLNVWVTSLLVFIRLSLCFASCVIRFKNLKVSFIFLFL